MKLRLLFLICFSYWLLGNAQTHYHKQQLLASDAANYDYYGHSVGLSGNQALVGAYNEDNVGGTNAGSVYVLTYNGTTWNETAKILASDGGADDFFGTHIAIDDSIAIISAVQDDNINGIQAGAVYVYSYNGTNWIAKQKLIASNGVPYAEFGDAIAIHNNRIIVGSPQLDSSGMSQYGAVYIFEYNGTNWIETECLRSTDGVSYNQFGKSIAIHDNMLLIGATNTINNPYGPGAGLVYVYQYDGFNWIQSDQIYSSNAAASDNFGFQMAIDDNYAIISNTPNEGVGTNFKTAFIFEYNGTNWIEKSILKPSYDDSNSEYGASVDIDGGRAVIGANKLYTDLHSNAGVIFMYENFNGYWIEITQLKSSNTSTTSLGSSVSLNNSRVFGGAQSYSTSKGAGYFFAPTYGGVLGVVYNDLNQNCVKESNESLMGNRMALITPANLVVQTNSEGRWYIDSLPAGNYSISLDTSGYWKNTCPPVQNFTVLSSDSISFGGLAGLINTDSCVGPEISIFMPELRPCFSNEKIYVQMCNMNYGTENIITGYAEIVLDSLIQVDTASLPYTILGNNTYRFNAPDTLFPGDCIDFTINTTISCNLILGQTLCFKAHIFPYDSCVFDTFEAFPSSDFTPCSLPWDNSSLSVSGWCEIDTIIFAVSNFGSGNMDCFSPIRIYKDAQYFLLDSVILNSGQTDTFRIPADGFTWRLEAGQHPMHPGNSNPNASVEICGDIQNWTPGLINALPPDDLDPIVDIYCAEAIASYDPNDKTGYPLGMGTEHYILPNGEINYVIRFQNTGTASAVNVIIRDTLDTNLDIFSVVSGNSSHNYTFSIYGQRVLEWKFDNINLPDSNSNEPGSHGFITFTVNQIPNLPNGNEINNEVGIYFDFNSPIITNETSHIIYYPEDTLSFEEMNRPELSPTFKIYPNPAQSYFIIEIPEVNDSPFEITDITGKIIFTGILKDKLTNVDLSNVTNGVYLLKIEYDTIKIIKQ